MKTSTAGIQFTRFLYKKLSTKHKPKCTKHNKHNTEAIEVPRPYTEYWKQNREDKSKVQK